MSTTDKSTAPSFGETVKSSWTLTSEVYIITTLVTQCEYNDSNGVYIARGFHPEWVQSYCEYLTGSPVKRDGVTTVLRIQVYTSPHGSVSTFEEWVEPLMPTKVIAEHRSLSSHKVIALDIPTGNANVSISTL